MNSFASISFAFLFLIKGLTPGMDLCCELQKFPDLIEDYKEYNSYSGNSLWQFFIDDYLNVNSQGDHNNSDHEDLPFNGNHKCCCASFFYASDQPLSVAIFGFSRQKEFGYYISFHPTQFPDTPFQPPKA